VQVFKRLLIAFRLARCLSGTVDELQGLAGLEAGQHADRLTCLRKAGTFSFTLCFQFGAGLPTRLNACCAVSFALGRLGGLLLPPCVDAFLHEYAALTLGVRASGASRRQAVFAAAIALERSSREPRIAAVAVLRVRPCGLRLNAHVPTEQVQRVAIAVVVAVAVRQAENDRDRRDVVMRLPPDSLLEETNFPVDK
jgi:hypothetical protein